LVRASASSRSAVARAVVSLLSAMLRRTRSAAANPIGTATTKTMSPTTNVSGMLSVLSVCHVREAGAVV